jgi:hypothetical protein
MALAPGAMYYDPSAYGNTGAVSVNGTPLRSTAYSSTSGLNLDNPFATLAGQIRGDSNYIVQPQDVPSNIISGGGGTSYGSGVSVAPPPPPVDVSMYDAAAANANTAIGNLDTQRQVGIENIQGGVNSSLSTLLGAQTRAREDYDLSRGRTTNQNIQARSDIDASTGRQSNALQRLLGSRGAGNSDAARVVAPYAAALQGTQQRSQVADTYANNMLNLDTTNRRYNEDVEKSRQDVERQRFSQTQALDGGIAEKRSSLLSNLANIMSQRAAALGGGGAAQRTAAQPYFDQVNALQGQIANYGRQYAGGISVNAPQYQAANLAQYQVGNSAAPIQQNSAYTDAVDPSYLNLLRRKEQGGLV